VQQVGGLFHLDVYCICWYRVIRVLFGVFESFVAEEFDGLGVVMSGETTVTVHRHSWEAFLNMSLRSAFSSNETFFW